MFSKSKKLTSFLNLNGISNVNYFALVNYLPTFLALGVGYGISHPISFLGRSMGNLNLTIIDAKSVFTAGKYIFDNHTEIIIAAAE